MKALGVALAACCAAVFWPSTAHANPIGARTAAEKTRLATVPGSEALDGEHDADDATVTAQAGLDHSVHFAATGMTDAFNDARESLGNVIDVEGLSTAAVHAVVTLGLRVGDHDADHDGDNGDDDRDDQGSGDQVHSGAPPLAHGPTLSHPEGGDPPAASATPEPASMLLIATGLAGVVLYRRRLFA